MVNHGDHSAIPGDYNVPEYVYVRISRYKYREPGTYCYYYVPAGIYFEFH
ncbi:MAG: hypothetical protein OWQ48_06935 [Desulfurococcus sp.]|nr:hypothetical protein [Desulfurococcus sp.]